MVNILELRHGRSCCCCQPGELVMLENDAALSAVWKGANIRWGASAQVCACVPSM